MLKDITLGQYFPGDTVVHRLDARTKIILTTLYIVALFIAADFWQMAVIAGFLFVVRALSKLRYRQLLRGLRPLVFILLFTSGLHIFLTEGQALFSVWRLTATVEGLLFAALLTLRIFLMVMGSFILTYTTAPMAFTDGIEALMRPLARFRVPVHELAMIMSMALRFVPTLLEETDKIMQAQRSRGADFETGGPIKRARALLPIFVPLFIGAFRRADELALAMEARCYRGGTGRTRMRALRYEKRDAFAFLLGLCLLVVVILQGVMA